MQELIEHMLAKKKRKRKIFTENPKVLPEYDKEEIDATCKMIDNIIKQFKETKTKLRDGNYFERMVAHSHVAKWLDALQLINRSIMTGVTLGINTSKIRDMGTEAVSEDIESWFNHGVDHGVFVGEYEDEDVPSESETNKATREKIDRMLKEKELDL